MGPDDTAGPDAARPGAWGSAGDGDARDAVGEGPATPDEGARTDPLVAARVALDSVRDLPLAARAAVFERVHATVVEELRQLELG